MVATRDTEMTNTRSQLPRSSELIWGIRGVGGVIAMPGPRYGRDSKERGPALPG